jgi:hypothetical protein
MMAVLKRFLVVALLLLAGCSGPKYMNMASSLPVLKPGEGRIYFYTAQEVTGSSGQPQVRLNRQVVGRSKPGSFFYVDRPAGNYVVTTQLWTGDGLSFVLNAGETRYVSFSSSSLGSTGYGRLEASLIDPPSEAERQLLPLQYWGAKAQ